MKEIFLAHTVLIGLCVGLGFASFVVAWAMLQWAIDLACWRGQNAGLLGTSFVLNVV